MVTVRQVTKRDDGSLTMSSPTKIVRRNSVFERRTQRRKQRYNDSSDDEHGEHPTFAMASTPHLQPKKRCTDNDISKEASPEKRQMLQRFDSVDSTAAAAGVASLLGDYEKKGVMKQVFGSQSVLSQELVSLKEEDDQVDDDDDRGAGGDVGATQTLENYEKEGYMKHVFGSQSVLSQELEKYSKTDGKTGTDPDDSADDESTVLNDNSSDISGKDDELNDSPDSFSQLHTLPPLPISQPESVMGSQLPDKVVISSLSQVKSEPSAETMSQMSALSGYDMILGAAQALAEQDDSKSPREGDKKKQRTDSQQDSKANVVSVSSVNSSDGLHDSQGSASKRVSRRIASKKLRDKSLNLDIGRKIVHSANSHTSSSDTEEETEEEYEFEPISKKLKYSPKGKSLALKGIRTEPKSKAPVRTPKQSKQSSSKSKKSSPTKSLSLKKTKKQKEAEQVEVNNNATRAAEMVAELRVNRSVEKQLLLSMALARENPRSAPAKNPPRGQTIELGFYWAQYPPLEKILRAHMEEYYELSITKCQSRAQQSFNNKLVALVTTEARKHGWSFDPAVFDEKKVRDRVRCFFKTHIQNAKKRLKTMIKNPTKKANAKALSNHLSLIEEHRKESKTKASTKKRRGRSLKAKKDDTAYKDSERSKKNPAIEDEDEEEYEHPGYIYHDTSHIVPEDEADEEEGGANVHDAAQVLALGFNRLSQDDKLIDDE